MPVNGSALPKWLLMMSLVVLLGAKPSERDKRVALVIGNGSYRAVTRLTNPPQDARDVGRKLESLGFEVKILENQSRAAMEDAVERFANRSKGAKVAVLYYSGHGILAAGKNYLIPVDAEPPDDEVGMQRQAVDLDWVVQQTTSVAEVSLIFMDACRNNPLLDQRLPGSGRDGTRDLRLATVPKGTVQVLYAASRGQKALDSVGTADKKSKNSPFAEALLEHLGDPDAVQVVAARIIGQVKSRTKNQQQPEQQGNLDEVLYLAGKSAPVTCPAGMVISEGVCQPVMNKTCPPGLRFEEGVGCVPTVVAVSKPAEVKTVPVVSQPNPIVAQPTEVGEETALAETKYRPKMVPIPKGRFLMGSPKDEKDRGDFEKQHWVELTQPYVMMETEVTQGQYQAVMGKNPSNFTRDPEAARHPVETVSWFDAVAYANRLSQTEGIEECYRMVGTVVSWEKKQDCRGYRLPTEAEWEYAARAGQKTVYAGSGNADEVGWYRAIIGYQTQPVKQKKANEWKLYDLSGNVWEWVWDCYGNYEEKERRDPVGPPPVYTSVVSRVVRGGGWNDGARWMRVAYRSRYAPGDRDRDRGFRLVRSYP